MVPPEDRFSGKGEPVRGGYWPKGRVSTSTKQRFPGPDFRSSLVPSLPKSPQQLLGAPGSACVASPPLWAPSPCKALPPGTSAVMTLLGSGKGRRPWCWMLDAGAEYLSLGALCSHGPAAGAACGPCRSSWRFLQGYMATVGPLTWGSLCP